MIELKKSEYPVLKKLFADDHPYVEVPMIINGRRGRAWVDSKLSPRVGIIAMGEMAFIEGVKDSRALKPVLKEISSYVSEICCESKFKSVIEISIPAASEGKNIFFLHDGKIRQFKTPARINVVEIDKKIFDCLHETGESWLGSMYNDANDFIKNGFGFGIIAGNLLVSAAVVFSIDEKRVNIGVATHEIYRMKGYSTFCTSACVKRAYEKGLQPIWITAPENIASQTVARKNGFMRSFELTNFWVNRSE